VGGIGGSKEGLAAAKVGVLEQAGGEGGARVIVGWRKELWELQIS